MKPSLMLPLSLLAIAGLSACDGNSTESFNETIGDPMESQLHNAAPVELPPALKSSKSYRCKDNSLIFVDFFSDDKSASIRTEKGGTPVRLAAPEQGQPFEGNGYKVDGSGDTVTITTPNKSAQSCKA